MAEEGKAPTRTLYFILTSSCSGYELLCSMLAQAGLGNPGGYFNVPGVWSQPPSTIRDFIETTWRRYSRNNILGVRTLPFIARQALPYVADRFKLRFVWLEKKDLLAQAITLYRADYDSQWPSRQDGIARPVPPPFDEEEIRKRLSAIMQVNREAAALVDGRPHLHLLSEALVNNTRTIMLQVGEYLDIKMADFSISSETVIVDEWLKKLDGRTMIEEVGAELDDCC